MTDEAHCGRTINEEAGETMHEFVAANLALLTDEWQDTKDLKTKGASWSYLDELQDYWRKADRLSVDRGAFRGKGQDRKWHNLGRTTYWRLGSGDVIVRKEALDD